jgi:hypothetical protein
MTSLFFGQLVGTGVPADEKVVRSTATPVDKDAPAAMQNDMPEMSEVETDPNPSLGMVNRQLGSKWIPRFRSVPAWKSEVDNSSEHNAIVDRQVSTSGYSASQEAAGNWGHGTMPAAIGIEPVGDLRDGGKMGNEYFVANDKPVQDTSDNTMMSPAINYDQGAIGRASADGKLNARKAAIAAAYDTYWNGGK